MKTLNFIIITTLFLFSINACEKDDTVPQEYPKVNTKIPMSNAENGTTFQGAVYVEGREEIVEKGFVYSNQNNPTIKDAMISLSPNDDFSATTKLDLEADMVYHVKAFIRTNNYLVYGDEVKFMALSNPPKFNISYFYPQTGTWDDTISIEGSNFSYLENNVHVYLGEHKAKIVYSNDSLIKFMVPNKFSAPEEKIKVEIYGHEMQFFSEFKYLQPQINSYSPKNGFIGDSITIKGENFHNNSLYNKVYLGHTQLEPVSSTTNTITVKVPSSVHSVYSKVNCRITGFERSLDSYFKMKSPVIYSFSPTVINDLNDTITIKGDFFHPDKNYTSVYIKNYKATIQSLSKTQIQITPPKELLPNSGETVEFNTGITVKVMGQNFTSGPYLYFYLNNEK